MSSGTTCHSCSLVSLGVVIWVELSNWILKLLILINIVEMTVEAVYNFNLSDFKFDYFLIICIRYSTM